MPRKCAACRKSRWILTPVECECKEIRFEAYWRNWRPTQPREGSCTVATSREVAKERSIAAVTFAQTRSLRERACPRGVNKSFAGGWRGAHAPTLACGWRSASGLMPARALHNKSAGLFTHSRQAGSACLAGFMQVLCRGRRQGTAAIQPLPRAADRRSTPLATGRSGSSAHPALLPHERPRTYGPRPNTQTLEPGLRLFNHVSAAGGDGASGAMDVVGVSAGDPDAVENAVAAGAIKRADHLVVLA